MPQLDVSEIELAIKHLSLNKAADSSGISSEHILHSHPSIVIHLKFQFSMMLSHSYVPNDFTRGRVIPIVKDPRGDLSSPDNYRPITISPIISKIFEYLLLDKFGVFMHSDELQFGFKPGTGCSNAIFLLRRVIEYFNQRQSTVFLSALDASKAFDSVNHYKLYSTLIRSGLPNIFINIIINWYSRLTINVSWGNCVSSELRILTGVRQGSCPIIKSLRASDLGCHIKNVFVGCIMYADDLILLSASLSQLQRMLNICDNVGSLLGITFNSKKSNCIKIGPTFDQPTLALLLGTSSLQWTKSIEYLGVNICCAKTFQVDLSNTRRKFFVSINSILSKCNYTLDIVKLRLLETHFDVCCG